MLPEASARLQNTFPGAPKSFQDNHFRPQSKTHNSPFAACSSHAPQLSPWNFQDNCPDPNAKFTSHDAQFAVHRTQFPFRFDLIVATYHVSKLGVHIQLLIVHRSRIAACCSYLQCIVHNTPFTFCPAQPSLQTLHSECLVRHVQLTT